VLPPDSSVTAGVLVLGGTGYIGCTLCERLLGRGHRVRVLTREASRSRVAAGAGAVVGDALDAASIRSAIQPGDVVVQLVGTPHPSPAKAEQFRRIDLVSVTACVEAMCAADVSHLVYVSVAHPAPVMKAYIDVRSRGESLIREAGLRAVILRPWYVLGPGHRWPIVLTPLYAAASLVPSLRDGAARLGLVTREDMVAALVGAVERPPSSGAVRMLGVPEIRAAGRDASGRLRRA
jgi:uncharacterized protein YbjT (DUF2867 family)